MRTLGGFLFGILLSVTVMVLGAAIALGNGKVHCANLGFNGEVLVCAAGHLSTPQQVQS